MLYALDSNAVIHALQGKGRVKDRLLARPPSEIAVPSVVLYELEVGVARSRASERRREQLAALLQMVTVLPFTESEARAAASARGHLEAAGTPIGPLDTLIAGTALAHRAVLVTHNLREFERVPGLRVEDWF